MQDSWVKKILVIVISVIAFWGVKVGVEYYLTDYKEEQVKAKVSNKVEEYFSSTNNLPDGVDRIEKIRELATNDAINKISSKKDMSEKRKEALKNFFGFYAINAITRKEYCLDRGVDISIFVEKFSKNNERELQLVRKIIYTSTKIENQVYELVKPALTKFLEKDMQAIQKEAGINDVQSCQLLIDYADNLANEMRFSTMQPEISKHIF